jgi:hypothetical protein
VAHANACGPQGGDEGGEGTRRHAAERGCKDALADANGAAVREQSRGSGGTRGAGEALARGRGEALADTYGRWPVQSQGSQRGERRWSCDGGVGDANRARLEERRGERGDARAELKAPLGAGDAGGLESMGDADGGRRELGPGTCGIGAGLAEPPDAGERRAQSRLGRDASRLSRGMELPSRWPAGRGEEQHAFEPPRTVEGRQAHRRARLKALGNAVVPACAAAVARSLVVPAFALA